MGNTEKVYFSVAFVLSDMEVYSNSTPMNSIGQGHLVTFAKGHLSAFCQQFQRASPLQQLGLFQSKYIFSLQAKRERKFMSIPHDQDGRHAHSC